MQRLDPDLEIERQHLLLLRRQRIITAVEYINLTSDIMQSQKRRNEVRAEAERSRELQRRFIAQQERRRVQAQARALRGRLVFEGRSDARVSEFLRRAYGATAGLNVIKIDSISSEGLTIQAVVNRPPSFTAFRDLFLRYEGGAFVEYMDEGGSLKIYRATQLEASRMRQAFRDGLDHCVFKPILERLEYVEKNTEGKEKLRKVRQRINKIRKMEKEYPTGVPEEMMEVVAKASGYKIVAKDILNNDLAVWNATGKGGTIKFCNTRANHLDVGHLVLDGEAKIVSDEEMRKIWDSCDKEKKFYMINGDILNENARRIATIDGVYQVESEWDFSEFNKEIDKEKYGFDALKYPEVNEFIRAGRIINAPPCKLSDEKPTGHLDMPKAYTQFKKCPWYAGFLGVIHQWRTGSFDKEWLREHIGIYKAKCKTESPLLKGLGIGGWHILPSVELLYLMEKGVEMEIVAGVWGSRMDFEFPEEMYEDKAYAYWAGMLSCEYAHNTYTFKCDRVWASHLKAEFGESVSYFEDTGLCHIKVAKKYLRTFHHILAFITAYVRIQMLEAMMSFKEGQIVKVVMDGLYFVGDAPESVSWFRQKEIKEHKSHTPWYEEEDMQVDWPEVKIRRNTLLTGQGGSGKTWSVLGEGAVGYNKPLFVVPQHTLGRDGRHKYGFHYTTINKLIGEGCQPYKDCFGYPPVIVCDELTQIEGEWIKRMFEMYPDSLIIVIGDIDASGQWFQCRNGKPGMFSKIWKPEGVDVIEIGGDRRSKCDALKELKLAVREQMRNVFDDGESFEAKLMQNWAYKNLDCIGFDDAVAMYQPGDIWIAGTHETNERLLALDICSGYWKQGEGMIIEEVEMPEGFQRRGAFTCHSVQGQTIEGKRIFVYVSDLFEYAMLYTAMSRATEMSQLVFVRK